MRIQTFLHKTAVLLENVAILLEAHESNNIPFVKFTYIPQHA